MSSFPEKIALPADRETASLLVGQMKKNRLPEWALLHLVHPEHFLVTRDPLPTPIDFAARHGYIDQITEVMGASRQNLAPKHFLSADPKTGWTALHLAARHGYLYQITAALKLSGKPLSAADLLTATADGQTPLTLAGGAGNLDQIFIPALWIGRVGELEKIWAHVPEKHRGKIHYRMIRDDAMQLSVKRPLVGFQRVPPRDSAPKNESSLNQGRR